MGAVCSGNSNSRQQKNPNPYLLPPAPRTEPSTDPEVLRVEKQFDELAKLLETMSLEFKTITENIVKYQQDIK